MIDHATLFANAKDGVTTQISLNDGSAHMVTNSIAFDIDAGFSAANAIEKTAAVQDAFNSWSLPVTVDVNDFVNADVGALNAEGESPRSANGALPLIGLRLRTDSDLIDKGTPTTSAPDLGAFELQ